MQDKVYLGGRVVSPAEAVISVFDRGFLYGDSIYEVVCVYDGTPFAFDAHLERLIASGERIGLVLPWPLDEVRTAVAATLGAAEAGDAYLRIVVTRGQGPISLDPQEAENPQLIIMALDAARPDREVYERGRSARLVSVRRNLTGAIDPQAKTGNYMNNVLAAGEARAQGADEAIMLAGDGRVAEGSSANVFAWIDGGWVTPPLDVGILSGITRRTILALCAEHAIDATERDLWPADLANARELFVCSTMREIVPIVALDGEPVGAGVVGDETRRLHRLYHELVRTQTQTQAR
jgi:branched-chain amino acid aminotransferase